MPKGKDPYSQDNSYNPSSKPPVFYLPYPADTNEKPFMTYESLMKGAPGASVKKKGNK